MDLRGQSLPSELKLIDGPRSRPEALDLFCGTEEKRLTGANRGAHRFLSFAGSVVTHVALHHQLEFGLHLGNAEWTGQHAVAAGEDRPTTAIC